MKEQTIYIGTREEIKKTIESFPGFYDTFSTRIEEVPAGVASIVFYVAKENDDRIIRSAYCHIYPDDVWEAIEAAASVENNEQKFSDLRAHVREALKILAMKSDRKLQELQTKGEVV